MIGYPQFALFLPAITTYTASELRVVPAGPLYPALGGTLINPSALVSVHHSNRLAIIGNPLVESDRLDFDPLYEVVLHRNPASSLGGAILGSNPFGGRSHSSVSTQQIRKSLQRSSCRKLSPQCAGALARVYVPNHASGSVTVIDPDTFRVVDSFTVGRGPQHVVPSWDLRTLWITNNGHRSRLGSVTPIDPQTGKPGKSLHVLDPYNMYFTPDGTSSIVVDEALRRLDFRDPHSMELQYSISTPSCHGINHGDFSPDGSFAIFTCEFSHSLVKIDLPGRRVIGSLTLPARGMPQDIRIAPDGSGFTWPI